MSGEGDAYKGVCDCGHILLFAVIVPKYWMSDRILKIAKYINRTLPDVVDWAWLIPRRQGFLASIRHWEIKEHRHCNAAMTRWSRPHEYFTTIQYQYSILLVLALAAQWCYWQSSWRDVG